MFRILVTKEPAEYAGQPMTATQVAATTSTAPVEILSTRVETLNLDALTRLLFTPPKPPRARRSDAGKTRKTGEPSLS